MSLRDAMYTIYKNQEYRVNENNGNAELISNDINDVKKGFTEYKPEKNLTPRIFTKIVDSSEIGDIYEIKTYALYKGFEFPVIGKNDQGYILFSGGYSELMDKLEFSRTDKYGYEKIVKEENLDLIYEKKTLITDFFD